MFEKPQTYRSKRFLEFVRSLKCWVCLSENPHAHHTETGGTGMKGDDLSCIPLCGYHHNQLHSIGIMAFEEKHNVSMGTLNALTLRLYIKKLEAE